MLSRRYLSDPWDELTATTTLASRIWTPETRWHSGDLSWARFESDPLTPWPATAWYDGDTVVAWARVPIPGRLDLQVDPDHPDAVTLILDWFEALPGHSSHPPGHNAHQTTHSGQSLDNPLRVTIQRHETHIGAELARRGYQRDESGPFFSHLIRDLTDLSDPSVPEGYRLRPVTGPEEAAMRAAVHSAAFSRPDRPSLMTAAAYSRLMSTPNYRPQLDWIAEHAGEAVAFCLIWWDPANGSACLEPVGCHPDHRRLGLASAVILAALQSVAERGATVARVCARGDADYPSARALYQSVGFTVVGRNDTWRAV